MLREVRPHHRAIVLAVRCTDAEDGNSMDTAKLCKGLYGDFDATTGAVQSYASPAATWVVPTRRMPKRALSWGPLSPPDASIGLTRPSVTPVLLPFDRVCQVKGQQCNDLPHPDDSPYLPGCSYPPEQLQSALEAQEWL